MYIGFWNIRGMVNPFRQAGVWNFVFTNNLCFVGILETKVPELLFLTISSSLLIGWNWLNNYKYFSRGRIWVGWNPSLVNFEVSSASAQAIHGRLK